MSRHVSITAKWILESAQQKNNIENINFRDHPIIRITFQQDFEIEMIVDDRYFGTIMDTCRLNHELETIKLLQQQNKYLF